MTLSPSWKELAHEALSDKPQQITADASDSTKLNASIVGVIGVAAPAIAGGFEAFGADPPPAVLIAAGAILAASVLAIGFMVAMDFRTRGLITAARFEALTVLAQLPDAEEKAKEASDSPASSGSFAAAGTVRAGDQDLQLLGITRSDEDTEFLVASASGGPKWLASDDVDGITATSAASNGNLTNDGAAAMAAALKDAFGKKKEKS